MRLRGYSSWLWLAAALFVVAALSALSARPSSTGSPLDVRSAKPSGALALYLWLQRLGYRPRTESGPDLGLARLNPGGATMMVLVPGSSPTADQVQALERWVLSGGRLVVATSGDDGADPLLAAFGLYLVPLEPLAVHVTQPLLLAPPVARLDGTAPATLAGGPAGAVAASTDAGPALLFRQEGRGALWVLTAPNLLDNGHIGLADNRRLVLNLVHTRTQVAFDEYAPEAAAGSHAGWLTGTVWGIGLLFALAVLILYRWLSGWRLGPPLPALDQPPRFSAEYVTSMAGLLRRARRRADVLRLYQRRLERLRREGRIPEVDAEVEGLLAVPDRLGEEELLERAEAIVEYESGRGRRRV